MSIFQVNTSLNRMMSDVIAGRPVPEPTPDPRLVGLGGGGGPVTTTRSLDRFFNSVRTPAGRLKEMEYYDYLEREIADCRRALDAYATMAVTGNLAGGGTATYTIRLLDDEDRYPEELLARLNRTERLMTVNAWHIIRSMVKYGSYMPQILVDRLSDSRRGVASLNPVPPGTLIRYFKGDGRVSDPMQYWIQVVDGKPVGRSGAEPQQQGQPIPQWVLPHFAIWSNVVNAKETLLYGTSILQPFGAIGLKVHSTVDAMVVARLTRAAMRYKWAIDVTDIKTNQKGILGRLARWQQAVSRSTSLLSEDTLERDTYQRARVPDADIYVPSGEGLHYDVNTLDGDMNLARVNDVQLLTQFYFGALGVPAEYLGHERAQGGRSNLSQIDISFARSVRFIQMAGAAGFEHIAWVDMMLGGWDPRDYPIEVCPPKIGARDDLLQAQIRALQSTVIANLRAAGMDFTVNPRWILETFLSMGEELEGLEDGQIEAIFTELAPGPSEGPPPTSSAAREARERLAGVTAELSDMIRQNIVALAANDVPGSGVPGRREVTVESIATALAA